MSKLADLTCKIMRKFLFPRAIVSMHTYNTRCKPRKSNKKERFCKSFFHFQIFNTFGNLVIDFGISLKIFF